jgi:hypothetical protein
MTWVVVLVLFGRRRGGEEREGRQNLNSNGLSIPSLATVLSATFGITPDVGVATRGRGHGNTNGWRNFISIVAVARAPSV